MDANEKAASFIGWKPDTVCTEEGLYPAYDGERCMWTCACGDASLFRDIPDRQPHLRPAPDMALVENYMRALEAVETPDRVIRLELVSGIWFVCIRPLMTADNWKRPVAALAALYDSQLEVASSR